MPIYMDLHNVPGITAKAVAEAHVHDLELQDKHACNCMTYWVDESKDSAFCLIEAPSPESVRDLHNEAHGLLPHQIIEVNKTIVEAFLGRTYDPVPIEGIDNQLNIFDDSAFRILVLLQIENHILLKHRLGTKKSKRLIKAYQKCVEKICRENKGAIAEQVGTKTIISFSSSTKAIICATDILEYLSKKEFESLGINISVNAGVPVTASNTIFGETIEFAKRLLYVKNTNQIVVAPIIKEISNKIFFENHRHNILFINTRNEEVLNQLIDVLENNFSNENFRVDDFCSAMSLSKSSLNRISQALTGRSPNSLIQTFRLKKALKLITEEVDTISQISFMTGFSSPSYFSKCFQRTFGVSPSQFQSNPPK